MVPDNPPRIKLQGLFEASALTSIRLAKMEVAVLNKKKYDILL